MPLFFNLFKTWLGLLLMMLLAGQANASTNTLQNCLETAVTPLSTMECYRGIPYRPDGALDEYGRWTIWADQNQEFTSAGLNCSGLTAAISSSIWKHTFSLDAAKYDRLGDSGADSTMGEDWDFGLDLILNLTDSLPRQLIPDPYSHQPVDSRSWNALDLRGVDVDSSEFANILNQIQPEHVYYFAISKLDSRFKGGISFYHVGLLLKDGEHIWMYHATAKGGVYRVNLAGESGLAWMRRYYGTSSKGPRYIQLVEVPLSGSYSRD